MITLFKNRFLHGIIFYWLLPISFLLGIYFFYVDSLPGIDNKIALVGSGVLLTLILITGAFTAWLIFPEYFTERLIFLSFSAFLGLIILFTIYAVLDFSVGVTQEFIYLGFLFYWICAGLLALFLRCKGKLAAPSVPQNKQSALEKTMVALILLFLLANAFSYYLEYSGRWHLSTGDGPFHFAQMERLIETNHLLGENPPFLYYEQIQNVYNYPPLLHALGGIWGIFTGAEMNPVYFILMKSSIAFMLLLFVLNQFILIRYVTGNHWIALFSTFLSAFFIHILRTLDTGQWSRLIVMPFIPLALFFFLRFLDKHRFKDSFFAFLTISMMFLTSVFAFILVGFYFIILFVFHFFQTPGKKEFFLKTAGGVTALIFMVPFYKDMSSGFLRIFRPDCLNKDFFVNFFNNTCNSVIYYDHLSELFSQFVWILFSVSLFVILVFLGRTKQRNVLGLAVALMAGSYLFVHSILFGIGAYDVNLFHYLISVFPVSLLIGLGIFVLSDRIASIKLFKNVKKWIAAFICLALFAGTLFVRMENNTPLYNSDKIYRNALFQFYYLFINNSKESKEQLQSWIGHYVNDLIFLKEIRKSNILPNAIILFDSKDPFPSKEKPWSNNLVAYNIWYLRLYTRREVENKPFEELTPDDPYEYFISYFPSSVLEESPNFVRFIEDDSSRIIVYKKILPTNQ